MFINLPESRRPVILIVDDVVANIKLMGSALEGMGVLLFATSGADALQVARKEHPDLVLLDIEMPGMDGYEVFRSLRALPSTQDCSVIFVTAHEDEAYESQSLALGGSDFLSKPINRSICRLRVQNQLTLKSQRDALAKAQHDLRELVHYLPAFVAFWGGDMENRFCNDEEGYWFGIPASHMVGLPLAAIVGGLAFQQLRSHVEQAVAGEESTLELELPPRNGQPSYAQVSLVPHAIEGTGRGFLTLMTDISDRKLAEMALSDEKERMRVTLNSIGDAVIATDTEGIVTFMNPIAEQMTGWRAREAVGQPIEQIMRLRDATSHSVLRNPVMLALKEQRIVGLALDSNLLAQSGREHAVENSAAPIRNHQGEISGAITVFRDASVSRALAVKMSHLAHHDPLTDLPNRVLLQDRIAQSFQVADWGHTHVAMLLLDLDHFKFINETIGHAAGDELLQQVAQRFKAVLRANDTLSRLGGDEFAVLMPELIAIDDAGTTAGKLLSAMEEPFDVDGSRFNLGLSLGISVYPDDSRDQETLMRHADVAMYRAKQEGRNRYRFFSAELEDMVQSRHLLDQHLRKALEERRFDVFYQGKVQASDGKLVGMEALVRMYNDEGKLVSPAQFIPLAEETGLIVPLGKMVLQAACHQAAAWHLSGHSLKTSVNIAAAQFAAGNFPDLVSATLTDSGLPAHLLELEITEGTLMLDADLARETLTALKALGVSISIDDFGTGYSSLAYLKRFPLDTLKIDQSFVRDMLEDTSDLTIIKTIIALGQALGMELVAEGVETQAQSDCLRELGCEIMQGYLYSRPQPASAWQLPSL
ncbi:two-component system response regulator [Chitinimonas naiadis]